VKSRFSAAEKMEALDAVEKAKEWTGWSLERILKLLGLTRPCYHEWRRRAGLARLTDFDPIGVAYSAIMPEEKEAVLDYALAHPRDGYRRLTWQMVDEDVACMSPSSVYRVLADADLLYRWKRSSRSGEAPPRPTRPNERWHTDIMYLRIGDSWYFLVSVIDAYSRYLVHWELLCSMTAADVRLVIQQALEKTGARPQIVSDNGSQFTAAEFKQLVRRFELEHIRIRTYHPESNGVIERYHRSTREALAEQDLLNLGRARELIGRWVNHYNEKRLHAGIDYLPPAEYYCGDPPARLEQRRRKLEQARRHRESVNRGRLQQAA
jgi:transposase InsO family protein